MAEALVNTLLPRTGTPDAVLDGAITDSQTTLDLLVVPANLPATGTLRARIGIDGTADDNDEIIKVTLPPTGSTFTIEREAEDATDLPKCAHSDGAQVYFDLTEGGLADYITDHALSVGASAAAQHKVLGYDAIGASLEGITNNRIYYKKVTLANAGLLSNVAANVKQVDTNSTVQMNVAVMSDSGGAPGTIIGMDNGGPDPNGFLLGGSGTQGWLSMPMALWLEAGDYWLAVQFNKSAASFSIAYDTGGTDPIATASGFYVAPPAIHAVSDSTKTYSIRCDFFEVLITSNGGMALLEEHEASGSATLDFTNFIDDSLYDEYIFEFLGLVPATNLVNLIMRMSTNGGSSYDSGTNYGWSVQRFSSSGAGYSGAGTGQTDICLDGGSGADSVRNAATGGIHGFLRLFKPSDTTLYKRVLGEFAYDSGNVQASIATGAYLSATAVNAIRFLFASGNIASGTIRVYGIPKTIGAGTTAPDYIHIRDEKASGAGGGTFTSGSWQKRDLTTEVEDDGGHASLATSQITLAAGTYRAHVRCPAYGVDRHQARLRNVTDAATTLVGSTEFASSGNFIYNDSVILGRFTIAGTKTFEVQHRCETTRSTQGLGVEANFGEVEIYTDVELWKEA